MSVTYLAELYRGIKDANPMLPVLALGIYKREQVGDTAGANQRRQHCLDNYGQDVVTAIDTCILFFRLYGIGEVTGRE